VLLVALGALTLMPGPAAGQICIVLEDLPAFLLSDSQTRLLVTVLADRPWDTLSSPRLPRPGPWNPRGQLVAIEAAAGPGPTRLAPDSLAVVVRWTGDSCGRNPTYDSLPAGSRHVFVASLRPDSLWLEGRPTWDAGPDILADYTPRDAAAMSLRDYWEFLATLPARDDWRADCRPEVIRVERWLDAHAGGTRTHPFDAARTRLRAACERSLETHAERLERWQPTRPIPAALRAVRREQGCRDDAGVLTDTASAVDGRFLPSEVEQWAFICPGADAWRLLVVAFDSPPRVIELVRMAGHDWSWLAGAAPPEYFDWSTSPDFHSGRWGVVRPSRDVVLLEFVSTGGDGDPTLAFFDAGGRWVHVETRCCRWEVP
jgi:hypothetical protein